MSDGRFRGIELRVHGIGDHDVYSALGSPPVVVEASGREPSTSELPPLPRHPVRLLNWSRTSRNLARVLWYVALPFSLVNVAGHMIPARSAGSRAPVGWLAAIVILTSLMTTAAAYLWAVAIGETVFRTLTIGAAPNTGIVLVVAIAALGCVAILARCIFLAATSRAPARLEATSGHDSGDRTDRRVAKIWWLAAGHVSTIALTAVLLERLRPSRIIAPEWMADLPILTALRPLRGAARAAACEELERQGADCGTGPVFGPPEVNGLNILVIGSLAIVTVFSVLIVIASIRRRYRRLGAMAVALLAAMLLLHAFASALRVGISWVLAYLDGFASATVIDSGNGLSWSERYFLPYQLRDAGIFTFFYDTVPFLALLALLSLLLAAVLVNAVAPRGPRPVELLRGRTRRLRYVHDVITRSGTRFGMIFLIATLIWYAAILGVIRAIAKPDKALRDFLVVDLLVVSTNVIAVVALLFVATGGRIHLLRRTFAIVADVVGFWPVTWHPLAGRSYRHAVIRGISAEVDRSLANSERLVLVGHSQGSVLCVWYLAHHAQPAGAVCLITCGSPVSSLYATFFPRYFDAALMASARRNASEWTNVWRDTDPIGTPLDHELGEGARRIDDVWLPDPRDGCAASTPKGHGDYWNEVELKAVSERWLGAVAGDPLTAIRARVRSWLEELAGRPDGRLP